MRLLVRGVNGWRKIKETTDFYVRVRRDPSGETDMQQTLRVVLLRSVDVLSSM
jgi:hypothetical protein